MDRRDSSHAEQSALEALSKVFEQVSFGPHDSVVDLIALHQKRRIVVEVKELSTLRLEDLRGRLATGVLQLDRQVQDGDVPLVVVVTRRFGHRAERTAAAFMSEHAPGVGWGLLDAEGALVLEVPDLMLSIRRRGAPRLVKPRTTTSRLFTDLNRWLLKVLLFRDSPASSWGGPRGHEPVRNPTELHRVASVSVETAHRFARTFQEADFLRRTRDGLHLVRVEALLDLWLNDELNSPPRWLPVKWLYGDESDTLTVSTRLEENGIRHAIGGYEACRRHGLLHAMRGGTILHVGTRPEHLIEQMELHPSDPRDAHLWLGRPRYAESTLRGAVLHDSTSIVDEWQAALDVIGDAGRGEEQARFIAQRISARVE